MVDLKEDKGIIYIKNIVDRTLPMLITKYKTAAPFPHIVIDNFISPFFLDKVIDNFPKKNEASVKQESKTQFLKRGYRPQNLHQNPCSHYLSLLNTVPMLNFLERLTGIEGLISDPYYLGGGLHETDNNGFLDIHVDFSLHSKLKLARRVNMIIFLNKDWDISYGGQLELWDTQMTEKVVSIEPIYNRCVIFNTTSNSYHGQPNPVQCPPNLTRRSIALYYYSSIQSKDNLTENTKWRSQITKSTNIFKSLLRRR